MMVLICVVIALVIISAFTIKIAIRKKREKEFKKRVSEYNQVSTFSIPPVQNVGNCYSASPSVSQQRTSDVFGDCVQASQNDLFSQPYACMQAASHEESGDFSVSQVQFSAVVPKKISKGEYASIDISVYEEEYREIVERMIQNRDDAVKEIAGSSRTVKKGSDIKIVLSSPDIEISDCEETQTWQGKYLTYNFITEIPENFGKKQILFVASVYFNGLIATKLKFIVSCAEENPEKITPLRKDISTAFVSYSSHDRLFVSTLIQGMRKARPELDIYCDIEKLHSGDDWEKTLFSEIERRDILFLCWSQNAKNSHEVEKEWRYALNTKGLDGIDPIPLVPPSECPPPEELKSKHFNDVTLLYRNI